MTLLPPLTPTRHLASAALALLLAACGTLDPVDTPPPNTPPVLTTVDPSPAPGGRAFTLEAIGRFAVGDVLELDGVPFETTVTGPSTLVATVGPLARGSVQVTVRRGDQVTSPRTLAVANSPPTLAVDARYEVDEAETLTIAFGAEDFDGDALALGAFDLPPGATVDAGAGVVTFRPDFIQGGQTWSATLVVDDGVERVRQPVEIAALDTIAPPPPRITDTSARDGFTRYDIEQVTDGFLDSPGAAGRAYDAVVTVPTDASPDNRVPVRIQLHGFGLSGPVNPGSTREIRVAPHDPDNTYWWGYASALPGGEPTEGAAPPYTARRVLALLEWVLDTFPEADPSRVYIRGSSMGGAGATVIGLLWARHFAWVDASLGQTIAANHRPARARQLAGLWGSLDANLDDGTGRGLSAWAAQDLTRALLDEADARNQFVHTKHGKDDATIHFGAVVDPSPETGLSFFDVLQGENIGHYAVWDEGGHGPSDPVLGSRWWEEDAWNPIFDDTAALRVGQPFVAFARASSDRDPGTGSGTGTRSVNSGYAEDVARPGDTRWDGELAGVLNRFLRWDASGITDTVDAFEVPIRVLDDGEGSEAPRSGYPTRGDLFDGELPVVVDVTPRRTGAFRPAPGETVRWELGEASGTAVASADGSVTVADVTLDGPWQLLRLERLR